MTRWIPQGSPHRFTVVQRDVSASGSGMQVKGEGSKHLNVAACLRHEPADHGIGGERSGQHHADSSPLLRCGSADLQHGWESMGRSLAKRGQARTSGSAAVGMDASGQAASIAANVVHVCYADTFYAKAQAVRSTAGPPLGAR